MVHNPGMAVHLAKSCQLSKRGQHTTIYAPFRDEGGGDLIRVLLLGITAFLNTLIKSSVLNTGPEPD